MGLGPFEFPPPGKCRACDIAQIYPVYFTIIKSRAMTLSRSPQCRAFSRAVIDEKSLSPLFSVGVCVGGGGGEGRAGGVVTKLCIIPLFYTV